jgi:hypothetical protein
MFRAFDLFNKIITSDIKLDIYTIYILFYDARNHDPKFFFHHRGYSRV